MEGGTVANKHYNYRLLMTLIGVAGQCISFMNSNPIMWAGIGFGFVGAGIGIVKKACQGRRT